MSSEEVSSIRLEFDIAYYFGRHYRSDDVRKVLSNVVGWLASPLVTFRFYDFSPREADYSRLSNTNRFPQPPLLMTFDSPQSNGLLDANFVQSIEGKLASSSRNLRFVPWIAPDDTVVYEAYIGLLPDEGFLPLREIVDATCGQATLFRSLANVDPLMATLGVDPTTPTLRELGEGRVEFPLSGYLSSGVVARLGRSRIANLMDGCEKVDLLSSGGLFYSWLWDSAEAIESSAFRQFKNRLFQARNEILAAMTSVREATP